MSARRFTQVEHDALLAAFRDAPGNVSNAAKVAHVNRVTAWKAWHKGWPKLPFARVPISVMLDTEREAARAHRIREELKAEEMAAEQRLQAKHDAIRARGEEAQGARAARGNALGLAGVSARLLKSCTAMVQELERRVGLGLHTMSDAEMRKWIDVGGRMATRALDTMRVALDIERIVAGEPIAVIGVRVDNMTPDQMVNSLEALDRTLARARGQGITATVEGEPTDG